jgi:hypothetical protein
VLLVTHNINLAARARWLLLLERGARFSNERRSRYYTRPRTQLPLASQRLEHAGLAAMPARAGDTSPDYPNRMKIMKPTSSQPRSPRGLRSPHASHSPCANIALCASYSPLLAASPLFAGAAGHSDRWIGHRHQGADAVGGCARARPC